MITLWLEAEHSTFINAPRSAVRERRMKVNIGGEEQKWTFMAP
jgi:hypothetical protein